FLVGLPTGPHYTGFVGKAVRGGLACRRPPSTIGTFSRLSDESLAEIGEAQTLGRKLLLELPNRCGCFALVLAAGEGKQLAQPDQIETHGEVASCKDRLAPGPYSPPPNSSRVRSFESTQISAVRIKVFTKVERGWGRCQGRLPTKDRHIANEFMHLAYQVGDRGRAAAREI